MPVRLVLVAIVAVLSSACNRRPDVVFLTIDTLRRDHVSAYNPDSPVQTPHIDKLAAEGVTFTQAWSPISVTGPAFCTLHTGQEPGEHGVTLNLFRGGTSLAADKETLAERLDEAGYSTGAFVSGFTLRRELGLNRGFDVYDQTPPGNPRRNGARTAEKAITWMWEASGPLFLWFHTYDAHGPWDRWTDVPEKGDWKRIKTDLRRIPRYQRISRISDPEFYAARYAQSVAATDRQVGRILEALEQDGRYDRALIVLTADHGESFTERELWFDHGTAPHTEQLSVPLIVKLPGGERAGEQVDAMVGLRDVAPTVLQRLGLAALPQASGRDLWSGGHAVVAGESSHCKNEPMLTCRPRGARGKLIAARDARFTLVRAPKTEGQVTWELYDRERDPEERKPLARREMPDALKDLVSEMWVARQSIAIDLPDAGQPERDPESDEEPSGGPGEGGDNADDTETQALRELGYLE